MNFPSNFFIPFLNILSETLTFYIVFPVACLIGIYLTWKLNFIQITKLKMGLTSLLKKETSAPGDISHFEALSAVLAGNLGTGNIAGTAIALSTGGPAALIWMWIMAILGSTFKYAGCLLGVKYREKNKNGEYVGGPMYYLAKGLKLKKMGKAFALFAIASAITAGNLVQVNSIALPFTDLGIPPLLIGLIITFAVIMVIIGGMQRFVKISVIIVPFMAIIYIAASLIILFIFRDKIIPNVLLILTSFWKTSSVAGGLIGYGFITKVKTGFNRGILATDAGIGIAPVLQASARTKSPIIEGIVGMIAPMFVMIICTITTLVLMVTDAWKSSALSTNMCANAFKIGLGNELAGHIVTLSILFFGFTTILAWANCAEKSAAFLGGTKYVRWFRYIFIAITPLGALAKIEIVWILADISIALMFLANMTGIIGLSSQVIQETKQYFYPKSKIQS